MVSESKAPTDTSQVDEGRQKIEAFLAMCKRPHNQDWSASILENISIVSHSSSGPHPRATFRLAVQPPHANFLGNLHGGCAATVFDACTTFPLQLVARPGFWQHGGVSRTLNVTYLRPVPVGTTVDVECEIVHAGMRLCSLRGVMRAVMSDGTKGPVLATCEHAKFNTDPPVQKL